jgi:hypothetical protein
MPEPTTARGSAPVTNPNVPLTPELLETVRLARDRAAAASASAFAYLDTAETPRSVRVSRLETLAIDTAAAPVDPEYSEAAAICSDFRHSGWRTRRQATFAAFHAAGVDAPRLERFKQCGCSGFVLRNKLDPRRLRLCINACHDRFCEACQREHRLTIQRNLREQLPAENFRFVTLTLRASSRPLAEQLDRLYDCFQALRREKLWRSRVTGGLAFLEIKLGANSGLWHAHLHVLVSGGYLPQAKLRELWHRITGDSFIVDVRFVRGQAAAASYVTKYASKALHSSVWRDTPRFAEAITALAGRRAFNAFGKLRTLSLSRKPDKDDGWETVCTLASLLLRARSGDYEARKMVNVLRARTSDASVHDPPFVADTTDLPDVP